MDREVSNSQTLNPKVHCFPVTVPEKEISPRHTSKTMEFAIAKLLKGLTQQKRKSSAMQFLYLVLLTQDDPTLNG